MIKYLAIIPLLVLGSFSQAGANEKDIECLAINMYHEARQEPIDGILGVGFVTLNRVADKRYPNTICGVVFQKTYIKSKKFPGKVYCVAQFSWYCDGKPDTAYNKKLYEKITNLARLVYLGFVKDVTHGATHYHADYVNPKWAQRTAMTTKIGRHIYYRL